MTNTNLGGCKDGTMFTELVNLQCELLDDVIYLLDLEDPEITKMVYDILNFSVKSSNKKKEA